MERLFWFSKRPKMESRLELMKYNIKLWNFKVQKLKDQQEITKSYLTHSMNNLQTTNEHLQKMEIFMADAHANPKFINQIIDRYEKEQEPHKYLPFMMPTLKLLSTKTNLSFVNKLFEMVNDPNTNSVIIWSKSGTSFFIKDKEGLQDHVKERFNNTIKTFYKKLGEFGFRCVDKFLCEYINENFQRDNKHMLKNFKSMTKLLAIKKNIQSDMEEELKRLKFFQNKLKVDISYIKEREHITKCDVLNVKRSLENASKRISQKAKGERRVDLPSADSQSQACEMRKHKQDDARQPWLGSIKTGVKQDIGKIKQELYKLNVQNLNLEQGHMFIKDQLAAMERIFPGTNEKLEKIESSMSKLFMNPKAFPGKRSRENKNNKKLESGTKKARAHSNERPTQAMNENGHGSDKEVLTTNFRSHESNNIFNYLMENHTFSDASIKHDDLMSWIKTLEGN